MVRCVPCRHDGDVRAAVRHVVFGLLIIAACWLSRSQIAASGPPETRIFGTLIDGEGQPLRQSVITLTIGSREEEIAASASPDASGRFELRCAGKGLFFISFKARDHASVRAVALVDEPRDIQLDVRLATPPYRRDIEKIELDAPEAESPAVGAQLKRQPDGTYSVDLAAPGRSRLTYWLQGVTADGSLVTNPEAESAEFVAPPGADPAYVSVTSVQGGVARIRFDPRGLPVAAGPSVALFVPAWSRDARLTSAYHEIQDAYVRHQGGDTQEDRQTEVATVLRRIEAENDETLRQALWLEYLELTFGTQLARPDLLSRAFHDVPPESPLWMLWPRAPGSISTVVTAANDSGLMNYVERVVQALPPHVHSSVLGTRVGELVQAGNEEQAATVLRELEDRYPKSDWTTWARRELEAITVRVGDPVPSFTATALGNSTQVYRPAQMPALYMIDFWATYCGPCVRELPNLQRVYERFHVKGFEVLSYSLDRSVDVVESFRRERVSMPWLHAIDPQFRSLQSPMAKQFGLTGIPSAFLVREGRVIAVTGQLRGDGLEQTITAALQGRTPTAAAADANGPVMRTAPVVWSASGPQDAVRPGSDVTVAVHAEVPTGWHIYGMTTTSDGGPVATRITLIDDRWFTLAGSVMAPPTETSTDSSFNRQVEIYTGSVSFQLPVRVAPDTPAGRHAVQLAVRFQACSEDVCLRPVTVSRSVDVQVGPK